MSLFFGLTLITSLIFRGIGGSIVKPTIDTVIDNIVEDRCVTDRRQSEYERARQDEICSILARAINNNALCCPIDNIVGKRVVIEVFKNTGMSTKLFFRTIVYLVSKNEGWTIDYDSVDQYLTDCVSQSSR